MGRPRIIGSPDEFVERAEAYFDACKAEERPITVTGLALGLGLSGRESLDEYGRRPEYTQLVKAAKLRVENGYEERLWSASPVGAIFALKVMGWREQQHIELSGEVGIKRIERVIRNAED